MKRAFIILLLLAMTISLAGCGAKKVSAPPAETDAYAPAETTQSDSVVSEIPTQVPSNLVESNPNVLPNGYIMGGGPVFLFDGNSDSFSLKQLDLATKEFTTVFSYNPPISCGYAIPLDARFLIGRILEQLFSPDLTKMAVAWYEADGSNHVGWLDYTGVITDVTQQMTGNLSEFEKRPQHYRPLFAPDGSFFYIDNNSMEYHVIDIETFNELEVKSIEENEYGRFAPYLMYSPLGTLISGLHKVKDYNLTELPFANGTKVVNDGATTFSYGMVADYIGENQAIIAAGDGELRRTGDGDGTPDSYGRYSGDTNESVLLLPETDYYVSNAAYSNGQIVFTARRGSENVIFLMDNPPRGELGNPQRIIDLPSNAQLAFWKDDVPVPGTTSTAANTQASQSAQSSETEKNYTFINNFIIEGKWKSIGNYGFGQAQPGAIVAFDGKNCNLYSPMDTYAIYADGDHYVLDATSMLAGTETFQVYIVDEDRIDLVNGGYTTELQRVG